MPSFGIKALLFAFSLVALWLSTFSGYAAGGDVRASVLLMVFVAAGYAAVYSGGKRRAFWAGFFVVMLVCGGNLMQGPINKYVPQFGWRFPQAPYSNYYYAPRPAIAPQSIPPPATSPYASPAPMVGVTLAPSITTSQYEAAIYSSIEAAWILTLAVIVGLIGVWVCSTIGKPASRDRV